MILLGGITWGVQLNFQVMQMVKELSEIKVREGIFEERLDEMSETILRATVVLDHIEKRITDLEETQP